MIQAALGAARRTNAERAARNGARFARFYFTFTRVGHLPSFLFLFPFFTLSFSLSLFFQCCGKYYGFSTGLFLNSTRARRAFPFSLLSSLAINILAARVLKVEWNERDGDQY